MAVKEKQDNQVYVTAEEWKKLYVPREVLMKRKYKELGHDPAALADFLAKDLANKVRVELSINH